MPKKPILRTAALLLCTVLVFSSCSLPLNFPFWPFNQNQEEEIGTRRTIPFSEMEYERPDADAIIQEVTQMQQQLESAATFEDVLALDDKVGKTSEYFYTMSSLAMIHTYLDSYDTFFEEESRYCEERGAELDNAITKFNKTIVEGPFREEYKNHVGDYVFKALENSLLLQSDEVVELRQQRSALNADYNKLLSTMFITYEGTDYTMNEIVELENYQLRRHLMLSLWEEKNTEFAQMYLKQIALDKEISAILGFDTVVDMYYMSYSRDYTPQEVEAYFEAIKQTFVPIGPALSMNQTTPTPADYKKTMAAMPSALAELDPQLQEAWNFMTKFELNNYEPLPEKQMGIAFTTELYSFDAPFCYSYWSDDFSSVSTIIHEFGHFYDAWLRYDTVVPQNLDISEVYSQGLEVVMQPQYKAFTQDYQIAQAGNLLSLYDAVVTQAFYEDFQMQIYQAEDMTPEQVAELFSELSVDYGLEDFYGGDFKYFWLNITHFFDAPFYTISYVTSAAVALQLWDIQQEDEALAAQTYLDLIQADQNKPFLALLAENDLENPLDSETLVTLSNRLNEYFAPAKSLLPKAA